MTGFHTLAIDTSTTSSSVALLLNKKLISEITRKETLSHSVSLLSDINTLLSEQKKNINDIDLFAVTTGPGSFTSLRIGIATTKALAFTTGKAIVGVSSLEALIWNLIPDHGFFFPCLDAKKKEIYWSLYKVESYSMIELIPASLSSPYEAVEAIKKRLENKSIIMIGNRLYLEVFSDILDKKQNMILEKKHIIRALNIGLIGIEKFNSGKAVEASKLSPFYIRKSEAELNRLAR